MDTLTREFVFTSNGVPLAGRLHRRGDDLIERQPGVLVTGSWLTVKEQMADRYAAELASRGYTAITFDFTGFGGSAGPLRQAEIPSRKIADIVAAAEFAATLSFLRPGGVGYVAVCASAQYALAAVAAGAPIRSFASVAGWFHDAASVAPFYGGPDGVASRLAAAEEAAQRFAATGEVVTVPAYEAGNELAGMSMPLDYYANPQRGAIAEWTNEMAQLSWLHWLTFDGLSAAESTSVPAVFVHGDGCVLPDNVRAVSGRLRGPVALDWMDGEQTDFYDRAAQVDAAVATVDAHLAKTLGS